uniref:CSE family protein n=1 Tax=Auxenochlorella protothecoides TaxID=3075 RepID=A0A1D1ZYM3_AUXPR
MSAAEALQGLKVPTELHAVPPRPLEEYVRARMGQFGSVLASRLNPTLSELTVQRVTAEVLNSLPPPDYSGAALETKEFQLVFRHDCLSLGCLDAQCVLCEHNPHRRCSVNFSNKYLVNDVLKAKCDAPIRVEVIDRHTGLPVGEEAGDLVLEMCILDGNQYDAKCVDAGEERGDDLEACALLLNNKAQPLLLAGAGGSHSASSRVLVPLTRGAAVLPDLHVSDSSEAMLSGRKPPFRLLVRASGGVVPGVVVRHAVSEGFVVATRRTRTAGKVEIPNVDDHVSKLEHMGKETVKKLQDVRGSGHAAGIDIAVPDNAINKVGEFRRLALLAEADGHLRQKLQQVLKLSKEKWEEARDHAMKAVVADNRMRIWYADKANMEVGLLFTCRLGNVDLDRPVGLLTKKAQDGAQTTMDATLMAQQTPSQRDQVRALQPAAVAAWWQGGHPGWAIYPVDSEQFLATGALDSVALPPTDHIVAPTLPGGGAAGGAAPGGPGGGYPPLGPGYLPGNEALLRAMSPYMPAGAGGTPGALPGPGYPMHLASTTALAAGSPRDAERSAFAAAAGAAHELRSRDASPHRPGGEQPTGSGGSAGGGGGGTGPSPFGLLLSQQHGGERSEGPHHTPSFSFANLQGLFGGDLSKIPGLATGLSLGQFPSIPNGMMSGELEQLLAQHGGGDALFGSGRAPSLGGMSKLESLDLPDHPGSSSVATTAADRVGASLSSASRGGMPPKAGVHATRRNSGLENMTSIEQALADVNGQSGAHAVMEAAAQEFVRQQLTGHKRQSSRPLP